jgi:hypothetical protein
MSAAHAEREHVAELLDRLLVRGVSQRDGAAYFDRTYHPDVLIHEPPALPYGGVYRGHRGAVKHARAFLRVMAPLQDNEQQQIRARYLIDGDDVAVSWTLSFSLEGRKHAFPALSHYRFSDGLIIESRMFVFDLTRVSQLLRGR